ncbi:MAG TPA: sodium:alanine symporter family protein, partial [Planctomycetota bacterium]|nr:sodium:alanine symporter family protein [Planctomycetota bacterium]
MDELVARVNGFLELVSGYLWGWPMVALLLGTHVFFTIRLRFIQRYTGLAIKLSFRRDGQSEGDVSQFGALTTALAATIGTGNIVGVATAVSLGGPGAVLWCWLTGVFGIATKYAEALLGVKYRVKTASGTMLGGPMYALERGLGMKWLGVLFAIFTALAAFGIGNLVQSNAIAKLTGRTFGLSPWATGAALTALVGLVILGGIRWIARVCEGIVPFMAVFYVAGCLVILCTNLSTLPDTLWLIVRSAFTGQAAAGGFAGASVSAAVRWGVARGLFSNESGLGSAPIVAAAAQTRNPVRQALVSSTGTFWDTVVVCALTGLVLVNTGVWNHPTAAGEAGVQLTREAFDSVHSIGPVVLTVGLLTFVFTTIIGWEYYGERAAEYLLGRAVIWPYRLAWVVAVLVGAVVSVPVVWNFADVANALMAIPNLVALLLLHKVIVAETERYLWSGHIEEEE